jgi:hypothetical protein
VTFHRPRRRLAAAAAAAAVCALHAGLLVLVMQGLREAQRGGAAAPSARVVLQVVAPRPVQPVESPRQRVPARKAPRPSLPSVASMPPPPGNGGAVAAAPAPAASAPDAEPGRLRLDIHQAERASRPPNEALARQPGATAQDQLALGIAKGVRPDCLRGGDERSMTLGLLALPFVVRDVLTNTCR